MSARSASIESPSRCARLLWHLDLTFRCRNKRRPCEYLINTVKHKLNFHQLKSVAYFHIRSHENQILHNTLHSGVDTPTTKETTPLLGAGPNKCNNDVECEAVSDEPEALEESELHKAKDFQLIHVPKGAVSLLTKYSKFYNFLLLISHYCTYSAALSLLSCPFRLQIQMYC